MNSALSTATEKLAARASTHWDASVRLLGPLTIVLLGHLTIYKLSRDVLLRIFDPYRWEYEDENRIWLVLLQSGSRFGGAPKMANPVRTRTGPEPEPRRVATPPGSLGLVDHVPAGTGYTQRLRVRLRIPRNQSGSALQSFFCDLCSNCSFEYAASQQFCLGWSDYSISLVAFPHRLHPLHQP